MRFFAGSERERAYVCHRAEPKKKDARDRFVAFLSRVESIMRGQNAAGVMMLKSELHLAARAQERRRYTRAQR